MSAASETPAPSHIPLLSKIPVLKEASASRQTSSLVETSMLSWTPVSGKIPPLSELLILSENSVRSLIIPDSCQALIKFLVQASPRYVPLPGLMQSDALFVNFWFQKNVFEPIATLNNGKIERFFEIMDWKFGKATVLSIKHFTLRRHTERVDTYRFRWTRNDEHAAEIFLISCFDSPDHVAVIPTTYMRNKFGSLRVMEGKWKKNEACPVILAPFMVHHEHLVTFLETIYNHAYSSRKTVLINPTYLARYYRWYPQLHYLHDIIPILTQEDKCHSMLNFYVAGKMANMTMSLSYRNDPGHFELEGNVIEYHKKTWYRREKLIRIRLKHRIAGAADWKFMLLEDLRGEEAICLPRQVVPRYLIGSQARHGKNRKAAEFYEIEILAELWQAFFIRMINPFHTMVAVASVMKKHVHEVEQEAIFGVGGRVHGRDIPVPRRVKSGYGKWELGPWCN